MLLAEHGRSGMQYPSAATSNIISWMISFFEKVGDRMPMWESVHLPSCLCKQDVYVIACDDLSRVNLEVCSRSTFFQVWESRFKNVVIPKVSVLCYSCNIF